MNKLHKISPSYLQRIVTFLFYTYSANYTRKILVKHGRKKVVEIPNTLCYIEHRRSTHSKGGCSESRFLSLRTTPILCAGQDRHFYFFLPFLLLRKVKNATIKLPKEIRRLIIPINIKIVSAIVISRTSLPMYSRQAGSTGSGGCHPVMGTLLMALAMFTIISSIP